MSIFPAKDKFIDKGDLILVTGAAGFVGLRVIHNLLDKGYTQIRCFVRPSSDAAEISDLIGTGLFPGLHIFRGNLLSREDCIATLNNVAAVIHLAAGRGEKSIPDAFMNSVVTTRNLLECCGEQGRIRRFVHVSSFAVYSNAEPKAVALDETREIEKHPEHRGDAYSFAKTWQEQLVARMTSELKIPTVILRPGVVYGPGNLAISGRVGIDTFGFFLHMGGTNRIPLSYVDNCAEAIVLAALTPGIDDETFNVVDDDLPTSREFLRKYKKNVRRFSSVFVPKVFSFLLCNLWERYSLWSEGQLPPIFNQRRWYSLWKKTEYTNSKLKQRLGWKQVIATEAALKLYFEACRVRSNA
jgi:nucleoside-diphosphate-sugar epimerase